MSMLTGSQAAVFADLAYDTASSVDTASATWRAQGSLLANQKKARVNGYSEPAALSEFATVQGFVGQSGAFALRDVSGFGAIFERKTVQGNELVVAFRGSQSRADWLTNFNTGMEAGPGGCIVHAGFNRVYRSVELEVARAIAKAKPAAVHFVGHSLGGALATLAMADHGMRGGTACHLYTFGAPRVGGYALGSQMRTLLTRDKVRRVYSISDPVPMLPLLPFAHFMPGATGLNMGYTYITARAHDRIMYRNLMPQSGWPPPLPLPVKSDPGYWLGLAEQSGAMSSMGYYALSMALAGILRVLNMAGLALSLGTTVLDRLVEAIGRAANLARDLGETVLRFVKAALAWLSKGALAATMTVVDVTAIFLRKLLEMLMAPIEMAARMAIREDP